MDNRLMNKAAYCPTSVFSRTLMLISLMASPVLAVSAETVSTEIISPAPTAYYLANEGVMVSQGETKILFDPLFTNGYGRYELLPAAMKEALYAGKPPFDGIDAIFVSHFHGDHFSPEEMLKFLGLRNKIRLYAPEQAVRAMRKVASSQDEPVFERVEGINLSYGDEPVIIHQGQLEDGTAVLQGGSLVVEAAFIPHSGWPTSMLNVQNIAFRVTLDDSITALHLGDADTKDAHFQQHGHYWEHPIDVAFPPYWYFSSVNGRDVLENRLKPNQSIGIHVPAEMPDNPEDRPVEYRGFDLFTVPGETRTIATDQGLQ
jgi:L-ascorbate metabolism protein UlaG (beta-lactamase superfamily)